MKKTMIEKSLKMHETMRSWKKISFKKIIKNELN